MPPLRSTTVSLLPTGVMFKLGFSACTRHTISSFRKEYIGAVDVGPTPNRPPEGWLPLAGATLLEAAEMLTSGCPLACRRGKIRRIAGKKGDRLAGMRQLFA